MLIFLTTIYIIAAVLLILFILLQSNRGSGMGILGGSSDSILGASEGDVMTKITSYLAVVFIVGSIALSVMSAGEKSILETDGSAPMAQPEMLDTSEKQGITSQSNNAAGGILNNLSTNINNPAE